MRVFVLVGVAVACYASPATAQWPAGRGGYWVKVSGFLHQTKDQYRSNGEKLPFLNSNAEATSKAVFVDALIGITDHLDFWAQVPYFDLNFNDDADNRHSSGVGDIRLSARYNLFKLRGGSIPISVRFTAKIPVVDFPIDAEVIPVGEGQWDYEAWLESGISFWPIPAYGVLWLGHRWRTKNEDTTRNPGNEIAILAELGGTLKGPLGGKIVLDAIYGQNGSLQGINVSGDKREITYLQPALTYQLSPSLSIEAGSRIPLAGKNFPAGPQFTVGIFRKGKIGGGR
jgi:Putative MetA-pathway of phenol degradation